MGEGAAVLVLETEAHAKARGANILAELAGYGATSDAFHVTAPHENGEGGSAAIRTALASAQATIDDLGYINAHGTSTYYNDLYETLAIKEVFKQHAYRLSVSSTKSMTGHLLGATGAMEAIFSVLAIKDGVIPPTINYETPDELLDLDYVPNKAKQKDVQVVLSNSLGFGGHNATLIFKKFTQ